ncbi:hypothetical protein [Flavobacterium sp. 123]|jgi:lipopolysaccharide biosynthesis glycosyltransferase|uniref:hypothetical protein n=1 Tax=Flavobacterium sp. 123 TaxID=2135627 RepID=UPI000EB39183|nr:hypothetical protein [Flavobacterium sp. 123]RKS99659.1 hypothetical protein C8C88_1454 [Flavobacterium sp. 123]
MSNFCTTSTVSHLYKTYALADSIAPFGGVLHVLLIDGSPDNTTEIPQNIHFFSLKNLTDEIGKKIISKYKNKDKLRWALKPVFLTFLLRKYSKVIYVDNDIFFFNDFSFLFEKLEKKAVLLTPHFYEASPQKNQNWLEANFRVGLYNAGFIGVNSKAIPFLNWWANCCLYNIKKTYWRGLFDDQKYLDLVPVLFDDVEIIKHRGCNLAGWNYTNYPHELAKNNINLIFIHFAELSLIEFSKPENYWHKSYINYVDSLKKHFPNYLFKRKIFNKNTVSNYLYFLTWKFCMLFEKN